jgi:hypothetical protein
MTQHNPTQSLLLPSLRLQLHGGIGVAMGFLLICNQWVYPFSKGEIGGRYLVSLNPKLTLSRLTHERSLPCVIAYDFKLV